MNQEALLTLFAPAERATPEEMAAQHRKLVANPVIGSLLDGFPEPAMILNRQRQIVTANDKLAAFLDRPRESLLGLRPGEAFGCIHSAEEPAGCGTTKFCRYCGGANAIVNSQGSTQPDVQECRIQCAADGPPAALDLRVWATPFAINEEPFTIFAIRDTTDEKRRQVLERLFFHDVLNTAGGLRGMLEMSAELSGADALKASQRAYDLAEQLIEEIQSQRDLAAAERGDLDVNPVVIDATHLLQRIGALHGHHSAAEGKTLLFGDIAPPALLHSDERLLSRVLGNLIKNALEASQPGQTVTVSFRNDTAPTFSVHNESAMPEDVQAQMFQRSFSTKGAGHGLGAYSVKLLTETYLRGTVEFHSTPADGTAFTVRLPQRLDTAADR